MILKFIFIITIALGALLSSQYMTTVAATKPETTVSPTPSQQPTPSPASSLTVETLPPPEGRVILTIKGNISLFNSEEKTARFDREMLSQLPQHTINTTTPWTEGVQNFEGVLVQDLLTYVQGVGKQLKTIALDNYSLEIPIEELVKYSAILAIKRNGEYLRIRDKGPIWVVYPVDDHPELQQAVVTQYRQIWHLRTLIVQ